MDDSQNKANTPVISGQTNEVPDSVSGGATNVSTQHGQPQSQPPIVSSSNKEVAPPVQQVEQYVKPLEQKIELSDELKEAGVENSPDHERPELTPEVKQIGVTHAKEAVELDPLSPPMIQLPPYKREEVLPHTQNGPVTDAARWFYTFLLRQIDKVKKQNLPSR